MLKLYCFHDKKKLLQSLIRSTLSKQNGSVCHITNCSRPKLKAVNNYMKDTFSSLTFNTLNDTVVNVNPGSFMATVDLQDAYRSVPIHPEDRMHFGLW